MDKQRELCSKHLKVPLETRLLAFLARQPKACVHRLGFGPVVARGMAIAHKADGQWSFVPESRSEGSGFVTKSRRWYTRFLSIRNRHLPRHQSCFLDHAGQKRFRLADPSDSEGDSDDSERDSDGSDDDEELAIPVVRGVSPPPIAVGVKTGSAKKRKREKYKSEVRYNETDAFQHGDKGTLIVRGDELPGVEWRTVPGFPQDRVLACNDGRVWAKDRNGLERTTRGSIKKATQRSKIEIDGRDYALYQLICRAFSDGCDGRTVDHGQDGWFKTGPDDDSVVPDCTDNRALNLRWATMSEQSLNRKERKTYRSGMPILVRSLDWDDDEPWEWFASAGKANKAKGVTNLAKVARGERTFSGRWIAKWAEPLETQDDLPGEIWVEALGSKGRSRVSNMGRACQINGNSNNEWGHKFTPQICDGIDYAALGTQQFHRVVFFSFGGTLAPRETVDHIDRDPSNNKLDNLRAATRSEQRDNQDRQPASETQNDRKLRVEARAVDAPPGTPWMPFLGVAETARQLRALFPGKKFSHGEISAVCRGKRKTHLGFHFRFA